MSQAMIKQSPVIFKKLKQEYPPAKAMADKIANLTLGSGKRRFLEGKLFDLEASATVVHIYFKELGIVKYSRDELYGIMDVIGKVSNSCLCNVEYLRYANLALYSSCLWGHCRTLHGVQFVEWGGTDLLLHTKDVFGCQERKERTASHERTEISLLNPSIH